mgnify:CR=1 FL=1
MSECEAALKFLAGRDTAVACPPGDAAYERTLREVEILQTLRHPCIVALHDCFVRVRGGGGGKAGGAGAPSQRQLIIVMTYCESGDLAQKLAARRGRPEPL